MLWLFIFIIGIIYFIKTRNDGYSVYEEFYGEKKQQNILMMKGMIIGIFMEMTKMVFMKMIKMISHIYAISMHVFTAKLSQ